MKNKIISLTIAFLFIAGVFAWAQQTVGVMGRGGGEFGAPTITGGDTWTDIKERNGNNDGLSTQLQSLAVASFGYTYNGCAAADPNSCAGWDRMKSAAGVTATGNTGAGTGANAVLLKNPVSGNFDLWNEATPDGVAPSLSGIAAAAIYGQDVNGNLTRTRLANNAGAGTGNPGGFLAQVPFTFNIAVPATADSWRGQVSPVQGGGPSGALFNSDTTGAANTAVVTTVTGAANARVHIYKVAAFCSAGSATLQIQDGATLIWNPPSTFVGTLYGEVNWSVGLTMTTANNGVITLGACGVGNTGTLIVQADRF